MIRGRHKHVSRRGAKETIPDMPTRRGGYRVESDTNDDYWWDSKLQELVIQGYDLPPNPMRGNQPVWDLYNLGKYHPEELRRLYWQCEWQGLGKYSGKHKPLSEQACKLITMSCFGRGICKEGGGLYQKIYGESHPIKSIEVKGIKRR